MQDFLNKAKDFTEPIAGGNLVHVIVIIILVLLFKNLAYLFFKRLVDNNIFDQLANSNLDESRRKTFLTIIRSAINLLAYLTGTVLILNEFDVDLVPLVAGVGVVGAVVGFGLQSFIKDLISGFFIIIENQYAVGDKVTIAKTTGKVEEVTMRMTKLSDGKEVYFVPHSEIKVVVNHSR